MNHRSKRGFPGFDFDRGAIADPRYSDCINPLRAAINLCDRVHTVSPTYAVEIRKASKSELGFHGGEGLERDLRRAHRAGRLRGILNGCEPGEADLALPSSEDLVDAARQQVFHWIGDGPQVDSAHFIALERLAQWRDQSPAHWITSISRLTPQKTALFEVAMENGGTCLENILAELPPDHVFVLLGSGDEEIEGFFTRCAARYGNFLFLKGYSEPLSQAIYAIGSLFLMPSSFEPCGIGQMLAMRSGQPCLRASRRRPEGHDRKQCRRLHFYRPRPGPSGRRLRPQIQTGAVAEAPLAGALGRHPPGSRRPQVQLGGFGARVLFAAIWRPYFGISRKVG